MTFTVYASHAEDVCKRLNRLARKAARYSVPFGYNVGEAYPKQVDVYALDHTTSTRYLVNQFMAEAVDFDVDCADFIKANGWMLLAKIEHGDNGNIVTAFGSCKPEPSWYSTPSRCEHCNTNRSRHVTYFCKHESGKVRQVGSACLHDYTGINPATALLWAEIRDLYGDSFECSKEDWEARVPERMYDVPTILAHAYDAIKLNGYRKRECTGSTYDLVFDSISAGKSPSVEAQCAAYAINGWLIALGDVARQETEAYNAAHDKAEETMADADWRVVRNLLKDQTVGDIERNCIPLALSGWALPKHIGRLVYIPVAYEKYLAKEAERQAREAERQAMAQGSQHVGEIGQRITVKAVSAQLLTSWESDWGTTYLYKFVDASKNVYIWYASRSIAIADEITLKATVKDHNERDGVKQTVLTRCKVM